MGNDATGSPATAEVGHKQRRGLLFEPNGDVSSVGKGAFDEHDKNEPGRPQSDAIQKGLEGGFIPERRFIDHRIVSSTSSSLVSRRVDD